MATAVPVMACQPASCVCACRACTACPVKLLTTQCMAMQVDMCMPHGVPPACLPTCLPACLPAYLRAYLPACLVPAAQVGVMDMLRFHKVGTARDCRSLCVCVCAQQGLLVGEGRCMQQ